MAIRGIDKVLGKTSQIFERRRAALYALSLRYAAEALNDFQRVQGQNGYWINRTGTARDMVFSDAYLEGSDVGWFIAHGVEYGVYLELANNRDSEALRPTINKFAKPYFNDAEKLYKD